MGDYGRLYEEYCNGASKESFKIDIKGIQLQNKVLSDKTKQLLEENATLENKDNILIKENTVLQNEKNVCWMS